MTENQFLPFAKPSISEDAIAEVIECLKSGWITTGPRVAKFEQMLGEYHGGRIARCVSSATAGLQLALEAIGLEDGDEVITTPLTFVATLNTIVRAKGIPVLVDIEPHSLNMDMAKLEAAITPRTKVIMPVHYAGRSVNLDPLYDIAKKYNLRVVEDCAHSIGTEYKGQKIGSFGDIQVMSFHPNKNMTTGEGGTVISNDEELMKRVEQLRFHGIDRSAFNRFSKEGCQEYDVVVPGHKFNMMDMQAALGLHQLPALDEFIARRTQLAQRYLDLLKDIEDITLPAPLEHISDKHAWHLFTILIKDNAQGLDRDAFMQAMKKRDIGTGLHYQSTHIFSWYSNEYGWTPQSFPHSYDVGNRICSLPLFPDMSIDDQDRVIDAMHEIFEVEATTSMMKEA